MSSSCTDKEHKQIMKIKIPTERIHTDNEYEIKTTSTSTEGFLMIHCKYMVYCIIFHICNTVCCTYTVLYILYCTYIFCFFSCTSVWWIRVNEFFWKWAYRTGWKCLLPALVCCYFSEEISYLDMRRLRFIRSCMGHALPDLFYIVLFW